MAKTPTESYSEAFNLAHGSNSDTLINSGMIRTMVGHHAGLSTVGQTLAALSRHISHVLERFEKISDRLSPTTPLKWRA